ncbi:hypothetical protein C8R45DRAFT_1106043 [Mycena sanguinolenta]|nr:hypothetical protein C8R45DRAFT_1106043 [Mycena sanguinolenta]
MTGTTRFQCADCPRHFSKAGSLKRHWNTIHRTLTPDSDSEDSGTPHPTEIRHPILTGRPCDRHGTYLPAGTPPPPHSQLDGQDPGSWAPFEDRTEFDFAYYHFIELQSSAAEISKALDLWAASILKHGECPPWGNAQELYDTIDEIQHGDAPWKVYQIRYTGPRPPVPPKWMNETYELCTRDSRTLLHQQLANPDFHDKIDYSPYKQFDADGKRVWSNLMSGEWAWKQADTISQDPSTHGCTFIPVVAGSDKTTVSVATRIKNITWFINRLGSLPTSLVVPTATVCFQSPFCLFLKKHRKSEVYQRFVRQLYHACLARVFEPLKSGMTTPEVVRCPDGHFRRAIYGLGPYIADYPEQVWLACIVQNWCPKCDAKPQHLDNPGAHRRSHEKTDHLITTWNPAILWDDFGIRADVVPFTHGFPRADIHELLAPDLLHQVIKGTFKDHLVDWVNQYLHAQYGETRALEIIADIDHRISAVPSFPGLRRFPDGRDFAQWTGDDSKALMKVYIAAIAGHVPPDMVKCMAAFMDFCYTARHDCINSDALDELKASLARFHLHRDHALVHYPPGIQLFGSPNDLCSSITESKHIKAVKEPWHRSSRFNALIQMLCTNSRLDKLAAARVIFRRQGMMAGTALSYAAMMLRGEEPEPPQYLDNEDEDEDDDGGDAPGPKSLSSVKLAVKPAPKYSRHLPALSAYINQPEFPALLRRFLYQELHPESDIPSTDIPLDHCPNFYGRISVYHSAVARFYAPSDLCGTGGMHRERIRSNPNWHGVYPRHDTVFIETNADQPGMEGMVIGRVLLFFSFTAPTGIEYSCALVHWFSPHGNAPDPDTGMWVVTPEMEAGEKSLAIVTLDCIAWAAHLLPVYGSTFVPEDFHFSYSLDVFRAFFVNRYTDHHTFEFVH